VNIDEELSNMMMLQQAYNAGARLIKVADQLYEQLLNIV
jgi:flagellar hook-associated protein FlgK